MPIAQHDISPKGWYSVQTCRWNWEYGLYHGYYKLYDNRTGKLIAESDFGDVPGTLFWPSKSEQRYHVRVGMDFVVPVEPEPE